MNYKFDGDISEITVTQTAFGRFIGVTQQRVSQMLAENILVRDEFDKSGRLMLAESIRQYYSSKNAGGDTVSYWKEKALREKINRKLDTLKLEKAQGKLYEAETVEAVMSEHLTNFRTKLLGISSKLSPQLEGKTRAEIYDMLTFEIENALDELARNYRRADFSAEVQIEEDED